MRYINDLQQYTETHEVRSDCNAITFVNGSSTNTFTVNNFPIAPGASLSFEGNVGEIDTTIYRVNFGTTTDGICYVWKKLYING